jgi:hypothetical protein
MRKNGQDIDAILSMAKRLRCDIGLIQVSMQEAICMALSRFYGCEINDWLVTKERVQELFALRAQKKGRRRRTQRDLAEALSHMQADQAVRSIF